MHETEAQISRFCDKIDSITSKLHQDINIISSDLILHDREYTTPSLSTNNLTPQGTGKQKTSRREIVHRRNLILTLYSYWESIVKESSYQYLKLIEHATSDASKLCMPLLVLHKWSRLKSLGYISTSNVARMKVQSCLIEDPTEVTRPKLSRDAVRPQSNLNAKRFIDICQWLDISTMSFSVNTHTKFPNSEPIQNEVDYTYSGDSLIQAIDKFVGHRNELAHSAICMPPNIQICVFYYDFIPKIIYTFTSQLQQKACDRSWLADTRS